MKARAFFYPLLWLVAITVMSVMPSVPTPDFKLVAPDKLAHAFMYGVLVWLGLRAFRRYRPQKGFPFIKGFGMFIFASAWGTMMEYIQGAYFPSRFFELDDMIANGVGAATGWLLFFFIYRKS